MNHNALYLLARSQKTVISWIAFAFIIASVIWFVAEIQSWPIPMEPIVVLLGGFATLFAVFWPWKPTYANHRLSGRVRFDYSTNNHDFMIGSGKHQFTVHFSKASDVSIYIYNYPADIECVAIASDAGRFQDIRDAATFDYSSPDISVSEGQIAALKNVNGDFALVQIHDVRDKTRPGDTSDEVTFSYIINPNGKTDFA